MDKNNPACFECPKSRSTIHWWQIHKTPDGKTILGANCVNCDLFLTSDQTIDMLYDRNEQPDLDHRPKPHVEPNKSHLRRIVPNSKLDDLGGFDG